MFNLFEPTDAEAAAHLAATLPNAEQLLHPRCRPHCARCGRWVPEASVRQRTVYFETEDAWSGTCKVHGERVDVVWDEW